MKEPVAAAHQQALQQGQLQRVQEQSAHSINPVTMLQVRDQIMRERAEGRGEATPQPIPRPGQQVDIKVSRL